MKYVRMYLVFNLINIAIAWAQALKLKKLNFAF